MPYRIEYSPEVEEHLRVLSPFHRNAVMDAIDEQLTHQPDVETRNRKPMRPNPIAPWELRVGDFRVYYDVNVEPQTVVFIRAVGVKDHNELRIGGEMIEL